MKLASGSRWTDLELDDPPEFVFWRAAIWLWERHWTSLNLSSQISKMKIIMPALPVSWISYENENKNKLVLVERFCTLQNALKWRIVIMRTEHSAVEQERWLLAMWPGSGLLPRPCFHLLTSHGRRGGSRAAVLQVWSLPQGLSIFTKFPSDSITTKVQEPLI